MRSRGLSLIEMLLVIFIMSTLLALGTLRFSDYFKRYRSESQTRLIYSTLLRARADAVYQRRGVRVKIGGSGFKVYSSSAGDAGVAPVLTGTLRIPVTCNAEGDDGGDERSLNFDSRGIATVRCSICVGESADAGAVDSIVVSATTLRIGKRDNGNDCDSDNITFR